VLLHFDLLKAVGGGITLTAKREMPRALLIDECGASPQFLANCFSMIKLLE
jgi:hypothetical protein